MARKRDHIAFTRGMAGAAIKGRSAARRCVKCGMAFVKYPGRYPSTCPTCGGGIEMVEGRLHEGAAAAIRKLTKNLKYAEDEVWSTSHPSKSQLVSLVRRVRMLLKSVKGRGFLTPQLVGGLVQALGDLVRGMDAAGLDVSRLKEVGRAMTARNESVDVITCTSQVPRLQRVLDGGVRAGRPCVYSSDSFIVPYEEVARRVTEGIHGLTSFLEGPVDGRYYRVEGVREPVLILELDNSLARARFFATENPAAYLGVDPRREFVDTIDLAEGTLLPGDMMDQMAQWIWADQVSPREESSLRKDLRALEAKVRGYPEMHRAEVAALYQEFLKWVTVEPTARRSARPPAPARRAPAPPARAARPSGGTPGSGSPQDLAKRLAGALDLRQSAFGLKTATANGAEVLITSDMLGGKSLLKYVRKAVAAAGGKGAGQRMRYGNRKITVELTPSNDARILLERGPFAATGADPTPGWDHRGVQDEAKDPARRKSGDNSTPYDGFRFSVGHNKSRKPRKDMMRAMQNRRNARRGLAKRVKAAKDWHRSPDGERLHKALGRFNKGRKKNESHAISEALRDWRPSARLLEAAAEYVETIDDVLDSVMRKLLVIEALDVLQDVEFDDASGSIYLFFSPMLEAHEVDHVAKILQAEHSQLQVIASPTGELPHETEAGEAGNPSDFWILYIPRAKNEGMEPPAADPRFYSSAYPDGPPSPGEQLKQQMVVQAPVNAAEQIAQTIDVGQALTAIGARESVDRLPARLAERVAKQFGALVGQRRVEEARPPKAKMDKAVRAWQLFNGLARLGGNMDPHYDTLLGRANSETQKIARAMGQPIAVIQMALQREAEKRGSITPQVGKDL